MEWIIYVIAIATFFATLVGGLLIFKFHKNMHYFFAFSAGSMIAISFLELLPESLHIAEEFNIPIQTIMLIVVGAFFVYSLLEKFFAHHHLTSENVCEKNHDHKHEHAHIIGPIGSGSLILHSFLDGLAIGIAFQADLATGVLIAIAVLTHNVTDGINNVVLMLKNHQPKKRALYFLLTGALAPTLGILATSFISIPENYLAYLLAFFVGEFLYIGAATLLPETQHHPSKKMILAIALGMAIVIVLSFFIGHSH
jgi:zinc transporter ZupT